MLVKSVSGLSPRPRPSPQPHPPSTLTFHIVSNLHRLASLRTHTLTDHELRPINLAWQSSVRGIPTRHLDLLSMIKLDHHDTQIIRRVIRHGMIE